MPYANESEVPSYVPQEKRAQWKDVWNSAHTAALKTGLSAEDAEAKAFREANGVAGPSSEKNSTAPYGDVEYADPGYQSDGKKRYPVDTEEHIRAAWNYIHHPNDAAKYSPEHAAAIKSKIVAAWKSKIDAAGPSSVSEKTAVLDVIGYMPFNKTTTRVDESTRRIRGVAASEEPDRQGEIFDYAASKPYIQAWSEEIHKTSGGKSYGNVREMHPRGYIAAGKIVELIFDDLKKCVEVVVEIVDDTAWEKIIKGLYTGFSFGGKYAKKWADVASSKMRYAALPFELTLADYPCIPGANFTLTKTSGATIEVPLVGGFPVDEVEVAGQRYELRWEKSAVTREESMTPEEKATIEKLQADLRKNSEDIGELRKVSEAHKAHLEAMAVHHAGMGHHLNSMIEDCSKIAKGEKIELGKTATVSVKAEDGYVSVGKTSDGVEIFRKADVNPVDRLTASVEEMNKNFTNTIKLFHDSLEEQVKNNRRLPGVVRPFVAGELAKTADNGGAGKTENANKNKTVDDGKVFTSAADAMKDVNFAKTIFAHPLGSSELDVIRTREAELSASR